MDKLKFYLVTAVSTKWNKTDTLVILTNEKFEDLLIFDEYLSTSVQALLPLIGSLRGRSVNNVVLSPNTHYSVPPIEMEALHAQLSRCVLSNANILGVQTQQLLKFLMPTDFKPKVGDKVAVTNRPIDKIVGSFNQVTHSTLSNTHLNNTMIWVTFARPGIHCHPKAPEDVSYRRQPHRHLFKFKVGIQVHHDDREIEFHMFLNWITSQYDKGTLQLDHKSCEMIAQDIISALIVKYDCSNRSLLVTVSEDDECGATVTCIPYSTPNDPAS
jgi:hypothetical protein